MKFYRNLGAITFENQTQYFQIFSCQPMSYLFQPKHDSLDNDIAETIVNFYRQQLKGNFLKQYCQQKKQSSIIVSQCKKYNNWKMNGQQICELLIEIIRTIKKINNISTHQRLLGEITKNHFFIIQQKVVFIFIPTQKVYKEDQYQNRIKSNILQFLETIKNQKQVSHRLFIKKMNKCKNLDQFEQQSKFFLNVYTAKGGSNCNSRVSKIPLKLKQKLKQSHVQYNKRPLERSKRKFHLFKQPIKNNSILKKDLDRDILRQEFYSSEPRKSSSAMHISVNSKNGFFKKTSNSFFSTRGKTFNNLHNKTQSNTFHESPHGKISFYAQKNKKNNLNGQHTPVNSQDEKKLMNNLQNSTNLKKPKPLIQKIESSEVINDSFKKISSNNISKISDMQKIESFASLCSKVEKTKIQQIALKENKQNKDKIKIEDVTAYNTKKGSQKRLKKAVYKSQEIDFDELEVISFKKPELEVKQKKQSVKLHETMLQQKPVAKIRRDMIEKINFNQDESQMNMQTRKNSFKKNQSLCLNVSQFKEEQTKRKFVQKDLQNEKLKEKENKIQDNVKEQISKIVEIRKNLNYVGLAVVNTSKHLQKYDKIFWHLPMFFLYRQFYFLRNEALAKIPDLSQLNNIRDQIKRQNDQIQIALTKLLKIVIKKLKKQNEDSMKQFQYFLNINSKIDCQRPMNTLFKEYLSSLVEATTEFPDLVIHQIQIIDAFLVIKKIKINDEKRQSCFKSQQAKNAYYKNQLKVVLTLV